MVDSPHKLIKRDPRYMVIDQSSVDVAVQASEYADAEIDVKVLDISSGGAKLRTREQIPQGQQLVLNLNSDEINGNVRVDATVCWTQLAGRGEWFLGCSFEPHVPELVLDRLAQTGVFDRREDQRKDLSITSTAAWELVTDVESVCIINISSRGFCLVSQQPGKPGAQVMLKFADGPVQAKVTGWCRWAVETEAGFTLGCEFARPQDYVTLRGIQAENESRLSVEKRGLFRRLLGS